MLAKAAHPNNIQSCGHNSLPMLDSLVVLIKWRRAYGYNDMGRG
jgi:hypothetical protein